MTTYMINKQLLDVALGKRCESVESKIKEPAEALMNKLHSFEETNSKLFDQHFSLNEEILTAKNTLEIVQSNLKTEICGLEDKNNELSKIYMQKEKQVKLLKNKAKNQASQKHNNIEAYEKHIIDLSKQTLGMHNELQADSIIFKKFNKKVQPWKWV